MQAIWAKGLLEEKNVAVTFLYTLTPSADTVLELAASNLYRLFVNGELIGYGPARAAHGYSRIDTYALTAWAGQTTVLAVEVYSANTNTFYTVDEYPFFAAEIKDGGKCALGTTGSVFTYTNGVYAVTVGTAKYFLAIDRNGTSVTAAAVGNGTAAEFVVASTGETETGDTESGDDEDDFVIDFDDLV
jgi:hypothetical protein